MMPRSMTLLLLTAALFACKPETPSARYDAKRFVKIAADGATLDVKTGPWACVLDKQTGLLWEVKSANENRHFSQSTFSWRVNGEGSNDGGSCATDDADHPHAQYDGCDTDDLLTTLNAETFCGAQHWRLPAINELSAFGELPAVAGQPALPTPFFPHIAYGLHWTNAKTLGADGKSQMYAMHLHTKENAWLGDDGVAYVIAVTEKREAR